jgi:hypothetical protein
VVGASFAVGLDVWLPLTSVEPAAARFRCFSAALFALPTAADVFAVTLGGAPGSLAFLAYSSRVSAVPMIGALLTFFRPWPLAPPAVHCDRSGLPSVPLPKKRHQVNTFRYAVSMGR